MLETIKTAKFYTLIVTTTQTLCFAELASFPDLARHVCAFREYPLRAYSHTHDGKKVISSTMVLANTLLVFYVPMTRTGRYISYNTSAGKEHCDIVESTNNISLYAPIINFESDISPLKPSPNGPADMFHPVKVSDIGSLARLTYDPDLPDESNLTLFAFEHKKSWVLGYITSLDMDYTIYQFNYIELESEPLKPFIKYQGNKGKDPEFTDKFDHGFSYLPIIKLRESNPVFGMS